MLDSWELGTTEELIQRVESEGGDAAAKLHRLITIVASADHDPYTRTEVLKHTRDWLLTPPADARRG